MVSSSVIPCRNPGVSDMNAPCTAPETCKLFPPGYVFWLLLSQPRRGLSVMVCAIALPLRNVIKAADAKSFATVKPKAPISFLPRHRYTTRLKKRRHRLFNCLGDFICCSCCGRTIRRESATHRTHRNMRRFHNVVDFLHDFGCILRTLEEFLRCNTIYHLHDFFPNSIRGVLRRFRFIVRVGFANRLFEFIYRLEAACVVGANALSLLTFLESFTLPLCQPRFCTIFRPLLCSLQRYLVCLDLCLEVRRKHFSRQSSQPINERHQTLECRLRVSLRNREHFECHREVLLPNAIVDESLCKPLLLLIRRTHCFKLCRRIAKFCIHFDEAFVWHGFLWFGFFFRRFFASGVFFLLTLWLLVTFSFTLILGGCLFLSLVSFGNITLFCFFSQRCFLLGWRFRAIRRLDAMLFEHVAHSLSHSFFATFAGCCRWRVDHFARSGGRCRCVCFYVQIICVCHIILVLLCSLKRRLSVQQLRLNWLTKSENVMPKFAGEQ